MNYMRPGSWVPISHMCRISFRVHFEFRFQLRFYDSQSRSMCCDKIFSPNLKTTTRAACYIPRSRSFSKEPDAHHDAHLPTKMHSQLIPISISGFDCISAFETSDFRQCPSFRFQTSISGFRLSQGENSKSRLRFQVSDFRLW
jgi:hypothetical protein